MDGEIQNSRVSSSISTSLRALQEVSPVWGFKSDILWEAYGSKANVHREKTQGSWSPFVLALQILWPCHILLVKALVTKAHLGQGGDNKLPPPHFFDKEWKGSGKSCGQKYCSHFCKIHPDTPRKKISKVKGRGPSREAEHMKTEERATYNGPHRQEWGKTDHKRETQPSTPECKGPRRLKCQESIGIINNKHQQTIAIKSLGNLNFSPNFVT